MSDPFDNVNLLGIILEGETDEDSPGSEELFSQLRENWEVLVLLLFYTGDSGTATQNPPNDTTGVLTDSAATFGTDQHNNRSLVMIDGLAAGNVYTIDDTTGTTLVCTGDNLYADGVRSGDKYKVFYNLKNVLGHDHDGVNSPLVTLPDGKLMLPYMMSPEETEFTHGYSSYTDYTYSARIYIPANAQNVRLAARIKASGTMGIQLDVGGQTDNYEGSPGSSYGWNTDIVVDVSSLSGWYDVVVQTRSIGSNPYLQGFSLSWEN